MEGGGGGVLMSLDVPHGYKSDKGATCTPTMRGLLTGECQHHPTKPEPSADDTGFPQ